MSRLTEWLGRIAHVRARKKVAYRGYRSETLALKMEQVVGRKRAVQRRRRGR